MAEALVSLRGISKSYEDVAAVSQIDLDIAAGEFVVLLGPSGSGKTTVLSMIGGFTVPTTGKLFIDGMDVTDMPPARRPTATVFQDYALFPHMSVRANVGFGLAMRKVPKDERNRRADKVLRLVGLEGYGGRGIHQLSGGQRQRVAVARAIAVEPKVLLLDEPLGALDLALRRQMQEELVRIQKSVGTTFVHVTHDQEEAMSIADRIVVMNKGRIEDIGPPSRIYLRPATRFAATFMGESNILAGEAVEAAGECTWIKTAAGTLPVPCRAATGERSQCSHPAGTHPMRTRRGCRRSSPGKGRRERNRVSGHASAFALERRPGRRCPHPRANSGGYGCCHWRPAGSCCPFAESRSAA